MMLLFLIYHIPTILMWICFVFHMELNGIILILLFYMHIVHIHYRTNALHVYLSVIGYTPSVGVDVPVEHIIAFTGTVYFPFESFLYIVTVFAS